MAADQQDLRFLYDFDRIAQFGAEHGCVSRLAWTPSHHAALAYVASRMREAGLVVSTDPAGNLFGSLGPDNGPAIMTGSHLDSVRCGGRFDGSYGVVAALEAARRILENGNPVGRPLVVAAFMDEEGERFGTASYGSRAFVGEDLTGLADRRDQDGMTLAQAIARWEQLSSTSQTPWCARSISGFIELHVEQGPILDSSRIDVGVVTTIAGLVGLTIDLRGETNHAGTTPLSRRRDALLCAARCIAAINDSATARGTFVATVGQIRVEPGGAAAIPGSCSFTVDLRAETKGDLRTAEASLLETISRYAEAAGIETVVSELWRLDPVPLDRHMVDEIEAAVVAQGYSYMHLPSWAGHDSMILASHVPTGMLFVPSREGVSHSPREHTPTESALQGVRVLTALLGRLLAA